MSDLPQNFLSKESKRETTSLAFEEKRTPLPDLSTDALPHGSARGHRSRENGKHAPRPDPSQNTKRMKVGTTPPIAGKAGTPMPEVFVTASSAGSLSEAAVSNKPEERADESELAENISLQPAEPDVIPLDITGDGRTDQERFIDFRAILDDPKETHLLERVWLLEQDNWDHYSAILDSRDPGFIKKPLKA